MKRILMAIVALCGWTVLAAVETVNGVEWSYAIDGGCATIGANDDPAVVASTAGEIEIPATLGGCPVTGIGEGAFVWCANLTAITIPETVNEIGADAFYKCTDLAEIRFVGDEPTGVSDDVFNKATCAVRVSRFADWSAVTIPGTWHGRPISYMAEYDASLTASSCPADGAEFSFATNVVLSAVSGCSVRYTLDGTDPTTTSSLYDSPLPIVATTSIRFLAVDGETGNWGPTYTTTVTRVASESSDLVVYGHTTSTGTFEIVISHPINPPAAEIYYTTDGSDPRTSVTRERYAEPFGYYGDVPIRYYAVDAVTGDWSSEGNYQADGTYTQEVGEWMLTYEVEDGFAYVTEALGNFDLPDGYDVAAEYEKVQFGSELFTGIGDLVVPEILGVCEVRGLRWQNVSPSPFLSSLTIPSTCVTIDNGEIYINGYGIHAHSLTSPLFVSQQYYYDDCWIVSSPAQVTNLAIVAGSVSSATWIDQSSGTRWTSAGNMEIASYALRNCSRLQGMMKTLVIPEGVTRIGSYAFQNFYALKSVVIPGSVTVIDDGAFDGCLSLESVTISKGVTSIGNWAFRNCRSLKSVMIPESVTGIGGAAFLDCTSLTNVVMSSGVKTVDENAFSGCRALESVTLSSNLMRIADGAFYDCESLSSVTFLGDAPDLGDNVFTGTPRRMTITVPDGSVGWSGGVSTEIPTSFGGRTVRSASGSSSGTSPSGSSGTAVSASIVVTNVVVHYVLNSIQPNLAIPITPETSFVTVITEVKGGNVTVPDTWAANYPTFVEKFGSDFAASLSKPTGKRDAAGNAMLVWQDFVAGTDPTDETDLFTASITLVDGVPVVSYTPELTPEQTALRTYKTFGKKQLQDADWTDITDLDGENKKAYNFFKVTVEMK